MNSMRSLAKIPRELRVEKPNKLRMKRKRPSRFLGILISFDLRPRLQHSLEAGNIVGDLVEEEATSKSDNDRHSVMGRHQQGIPAGLVSRYLASDAVRFAHRYRFLKALPLSNLNCVQ